MTVAEVFDRIWLGVNIVAAGVLVTALIMTA